jgi:hypothetical protein
VYETPAERLRLPLATAMLKANWPEMSKPAWMAWIPLKPATMPK